MSQIHVLRVLFICFGTPFAIAGWRDFYVENRMLHHGVIACLATALIAIGIVG